MGSFPGNDYRLGIICSYRKYLSAAFRSSRQSCRPAYRRSCYEVYLGETLLTSGAILLTGLFCGKSKRTAARLVFVLVLLFTAAITFCFFYSILHQSAEGFTLTPAFIPDTKAFSSICFIAVVSPWAFIGFENISHSVEGFAFHHKKSFGILVSAIVTATALYIFIILLSVSAYPPEYDSWLSYLKDLGNLQGLKALPPFYAAHHYLGNLGTSLLMLALLFPIITSLIGNMVALSRLLYALAKDDVIPSRFAQLNKGHIPENAVRAITLISIFVPLVGRAAIGWIVDVTTVGAVIIYGLLSWATWKFARVEGKSLEQFTGMSGLILMIVFGIFLIVPNPLTNNAITQEAHFLFIVWAIMGFVVFYHIIKRDKSGKFGASVTVWIGLITLVLILSLIWLLRSNNDAIALAEEKIFRFIHGMASPEDYAMGEDLYMRKAMSSIYDANLKDIFIVMALFVLAIVMQFSSIMVLKKREEAFNERIGKVTNIANTDAMTGVKNKRAYAEYEAKINSRILSETLSNFAIVICDVNGLKTINDSQGHKAGDELIKSACRMICKLFKHSPVFRFGGDEFVVILTDDDFNSREELLRQLNSQVEENLRNDGVVVAAGMAEFIFGRDCSMSTVFDRADTRMYLRKRELKEDIN